VIFEAAGFHSRLVVGASSAGQPDSGTMEFCPPRAAAAQIVPRRGALRQRKGGWGGAEKAPTRAISRCLAQR